MLWALNSDHQPVLIRTGAAGVPDARFFCPRCGARLILVVPKERTEYFRHYANEACDFKGEIMSRRDFTRIFLDGYESKPVVVKIWCERKQVYVWMLHTIRTFSLMRNRFKSQCFHEGLKRDFKQINGRLLPECMTLVVGYE